MTESFKDLIVWQKSMLLVKEVYALSHKITKQEQYGLISQMRRSAISIPSNIAEGSKRGTRKDYVQFLRIALGSSAELETQLILIKELYALDTTEIESLLIEIQKMLSTLIKKLNSNI